MASTVRVPIRIRIEADDVVARASDVRDRVEATVTRALDRSVRTVLARHGGPVTFEAPAFRWTGEAVEPAVRAAIERQLGEVIEKAAASLPRSPERRERDPARERFEAARAAAGRYALPSYDGKGADVTAPLVAAPTHERWASPPPTKPTLAALKKLLGEHWPGVELVSGVGVFWYERSDQKFWAWFEYDDEQHILDLGPASTREWDGKKFVKRLQPIPKPDRGEVEVIATFDGGASDDGLRAYVERYDGASIREALKGDAVAAEIERRVKAFAAAKLAMVVELRIEGWRARYHYTRSDLKFDGTVALYPISETVARTGHGGSLAGAGDSKAGRSGAKGGTGTGAGEHGDAKDDKGGPGGAEGGGDTGTPIADPKFVAPFDPFGYGHDEALVCESFLGEPLVDTLGASGQNLKAQIATLATRLQIEPCGYAGQFCLMAAQVLATYARGIGDSVAISRDAAVTEYRKDNSGNLGSIEMRPRTVANVLLARLAGAVPLIERLARDVIRTYDDTPGALTGQYARSPAGWVLHFLEEFEEPMTLTMLQVFGQTCRILMVQLLDASRAHIENRSANIANFAKSFYDTLLPSLTKLSDLMKLKNRLDIASAPSTVTEDGFVIPTPHYDDVVYVDGDAKAVTDDDGRQWTTAQLETAIALRRGAAEDLEPLVKHFDDLPRTVDRMRAGEAATRDELSDLFDRMLSSNSDVRNRVAWSWEEAFKYGPIDTDLPETSPAEIGRNMRGIHRLAHEELAPRVGSSPHYAQGVRWLFEGEHALEVIESLVELGALVVISVLCPPAGAALGIVVAAAHYLDAVEKSEIRDALLNADEIVDLAQLDAERFAAALGLALSVIPEASTIVRGAYKAGTIAIEEGVVALARRTVVVATETAIAAMEKALAQGIAKAICKEFVKVEIMNALLSRAMEPLVRAEYERASAAGPVGGTAGALQLLTWYRAKQKAT